MFLSELNFQFIKETGKNYNFFLKNILTIEFKYDSYRYRITKLLRM
jgi:hypothetical protein